MNTTLQHLCGKAFQTFSDRIVLQLDETNETLTYGDADEIVGRIEAALAESGVEQGDFVCSIAPLNVQSVLLAWACFRHAAVFVPLDHHWAACLLNGVIAELNPRLLFASSSLIDGLDAHNRVCYDFSPRQRSFEDWLSDGENQTVAPVPPRVNEHDLALVLYTSGSTGTPKGVMLSHGALFRSAQLVAELFKWSDDDAFLNLGDLYAMSGFRNTCLAPLCVGASAIIASEESRGTALLLPNLVKRNQCTFVGVGPIVVRQLNMSAHRIAPSAMESLRAVLCTGGYLDSQQVSLFHDAFGLPVLNYYGLTETAGLCAGHGFDTFGVNEESIGPEIGATLQVVDDRGAELPDGEVGHLRIKSPNMMIGYLGKPELTEQAYIDGWYYTGDLAERRSDGQFVLRGRTRNIIKVSTTDLIYLEEVEQVLARHALVRDAGIYSYTSQHGEERMGACIVPVNSFEKESFDGLSRKLIEFIVNTIGKRKVPHRFHYMENLPRNSAGKLLRQELKETFNA